MTMEEGSRGCVPLYRDLLGVGQVGRADVSLGVENSLSVCPQMQAHGTLSFLGTGELVWDRRLLLRTRSQAYLAVSQFLHGLQPCLTPG